MGIFDFKAYGFIAEALRFRLAWYQQQLGREDLSDELYLRAVLATVEREREKSANA